MQDIIPVRGRVYYARLNEKAERKPYLVVSNNARNQKLDDCLAVRITTTKKPELASIVKLTAADAPLVGSVLCDSIILFYRDELLQDAGAVSADTMMRVAAGLRAALAI